MLPPMGRGSPSPPLLARPLPSLLPSLSVLLALLPPSLSLLLPLAMLQRSSPAPEALASPLKGEAFSLSPRFSAMLSRSDLIALLELVETNAQYDDDETASYWLSVAERLSEELNSLPLS